jgi:hypothetical protein
MELLNNFLHNIFTDAALPRLPTHNICAMQWEDERLINVNFNNERGQIHEINCGHYFIVVACWLSFFSRSEP